MSGLATTEIVELLRTATSAAGSVAAWAREHQVSVPYVHDVLHGNRQPGARILSALGLEKVVIIAAQESRK